jgi:prolipoprotein diacylglyceryltransferase
VRRWNNDRGGNGVAQALWYVPFDLKWYAVVLMVELSVSWWLQRHHPPLKFTIETELTRP